MQTYNIYNALKVTFILSRWSGEQIFLVSSAKETWSQKVRSRYDHRTFSVSLVLTVGRITILQLLNASIYWQKKVCSKASFTWLPFIGRFFCRQSVFAGRPLRKIQMPKPRPTDDRHKISVNRWSDDDRGLLDRLIKDFFNWRSRPPTQKKL